MLTCFSHRRKEEREAVCDGACPADVLSRSAEPSQGLGAPRRPVAKLFLHLQWAKRKIEQNIRMPSNQARSVAKFDKHGMKPFQCALHSVSRAQDATTERKFLPGFRSFPTSIKR